MKPKYEACTKCGLREIRHELERKGIIIRFCEECYWGEIEDMGPEPEARQQRTGEPAVPGAAPK